MLISSLRTPGYCYFNGIVMLWTEARNYIYFWGLRKQSILLKSPGVQGSTLTSLTSIKSDMQILLLTWHSACWVLIGLWQKKFLSISILGLCCEVCETHFCYSILDYYYLIFLLILFSTTVKWEVEDLRFRDKTAWIGANFLCSFAWSVILFFWLLMHSGVRIHQF